MVCVMVTGGAGYVGSHTCKALAASGIAPITFDNLSCGHAEAVLWGSLDIGDILNADALRRSFQEHQPVAVLHFAASAYVGESLHDPSKYYRNNVVGTHHVLEAARETGVGIFVFSSSCATYGLAEDLPIRETMPQRPINPYGRTKLMCEQMLADYSASYGMRYVSLRYFNAAGADPEGEIGEWHDPETHLIPRALLAAAGRLDHLEIFGDDHPTADGTCIRDFVHVTDLADAHVGAVRYLLDGGSSLAANLGTGQGTSIREVVETVKAVTGLNVPIVIRPRRGGDPPTLLADASLAVNRLSFAPRLSDISTIVETAAPFFFRA
jgi:UDP-arabinose 4-epimerase